MLGCLVVSLQKLLKATAYYIPLTQGCPSLQQLQAGHHCAQHHNIVGGDCVLV